MKALTFSEYGSSDVLEYKEVPVPVIKEQEVLIKMEAIGLNYADIYRRRGNYHLAGNPPYILGYEGAGTIIQSKSKEYQTGQRIGFVDVPFANAQYVACHEDHVIPLPEEINSYLAASVLLQGLTAHYLVNDSYQVQESETVVIHAASGGVGQILCQLCKRQNTKVIGLTRNENKIDTIVNCNVDHALVLEKDWKNKILSLNNNEGVDVVYDSVGSTLKESFEITKNGGHVVFYGMSGGNPEFVDPRMLMDTSKSLTGGDLWCYLTSKEERIKRSKALFKMIIQEEIKIKEPVKFKLSQGKEAHDYLEQGMSSGKVLLIPN